MRPLVYTALASALLCAPVKADLEADFRSPPVAARPYVWWHWMGPNFTTEGITRDLEAMKASGIGGATIFNITSGVQESAAPIADNPWPEQIYRGDAYWAAIAHAAREAGRLGLEVGLHNTVGYSTTGGPWITQERAMQRVVWSELAVTGGTSATWVLPQPASAPYRGWGGGIKEPIAFYRDIAVLAAPADGVIERDSIIDLTSRMDAAGRLGWDAPPGAWKIYRFGHAPTGATPHPLPDDVLGRALEADKMNRDHTRFHWEQVLAPLRKHLGAELGRSFGHVLIDSYEAGPQSWTPGFREEFLRRKGYDPVPWLLSLGQPVTHDKANPARRVVETEEQTARFEYDYKEVVAALYLENGWEPARALIHEAGLTLQFEAYGGPFDTVAGSALADLPMGEFWSQSGGGISSVIVGAGRAAGRGVIGAEAFTGLPQNSRWDETPGKLRLSADGSFASGVNRLILHHWVHQPFDDRYRPGYGMGWWGVHFGRNQTWFEPGKAFFAYLGRVQAMLQRGEQSIDVLSVGRVVGSSDVVSFPVFLNALRVNDGKIVTPAGRRYAVLVVPHDKTLTPEAVRRVLELARAGATVASTRPERSPSLQGYPACDDEVRRLALEGWGEGGEAVRTLGAGRLYASDNPNAALRDLGLNQPWVRVLGENAKQVRALERHDVATGSRFFFIANQVATPSRVTASFRVTGFTPELWDAEDGSIRPAPNWRVRDGRTEVDLAFAGIDSVFVVFRQPTQATGAVTAEPIEVGSAVLEGPWELEFPVTAGAPRLVTLPRLTSWTEQTEPSVRHFSGTVRYRASLRIDPGWLAEGRILRLDLGQVADLASVRLNGRELGVLWCAPYRVDLGPAARAGENSLEIAVTNTWHNRLVGDELEPSDLDWGPTRQFGGKDVGRPLARFPAWLLGNGPRPSVGRSTFVTWNYFTKDEPLLPAGLLGPVRLDCLAPPSSPP